MNAYQHFAYYYDDVFEELDYSLWLDFIQPYLMKTSSILDLACGSGTFAILLKLKGYTVEGLDLSSSIIDIAKEKAKMNHLDIPFYVGNMIEFQLEKQYEMITCFFDSINFLKTKEDIQRMLDCVSSHLVPGGYFICDIFTKKLFSEYKHHKLKKKYTTHKLKWHTKAYSNTILQHTILIQEGDLKLEENYFEYWHSMDEIITEDFELVKTTGDFEEQLTKKSNRILIVLQKKLNRY